MKRALSIFVKPASSRCNLACKYCFYVDSANVRAVGDRGIMSCETVEIVLKKAIDFVDGGFLHVAFQGGEPLVAGLEFYKNFVETADSLNQKLAKITYSVQTNGVLITEEFAKLFAENKFLVGVSLDGNEVLHNLHRVYANGKGSFKDVVSGISALEKAGVEYNVVTVVTKAIANKIQTVYNFYKRKGFKFLQFIPQIKDFDNKDSEFNLSDEDYYLFLEKLYKLWSDDIKNGCYTSIRLFDNIGNFLLGREFESCDLKGVCSLQFVIEADGAVYPCDFYAIDEFQIGNILSDEFMQIATNPVAESFVNESKSKPEECYSCKFFKICRGGCKRYHDENGKFRFCGTFKRFYENYLLDFRSLVNTYFK